MSEGKSRATTAGVDVAADGPLSPSVKRVTTDPEENAQRLLRVDQVHDRKTRRVHFLKTRKTRPKLTRFGDPVLRVRRIIDKHGMPEKVEVDINSDNLKQVFQDVYGNLRVLHNAGVRGLRLNKSPPVATDQLFFWARPDLLKIKEKEESQDEPDRGLVKDLGTALQFVDEEFSEQTASLKPLLEKGEITFDLLWTIFPPGEFLLAENDGIMKQTQGLKTNGARYINRDGSRLFDIDCIVLTHDGQHFGMGSWNWWISDFDGTKRIETLIVYPLKFHAKGAALRAELTSRGEKFVRLLKAPTCQQYKSSSAVAEADLVRARPKLEKCNAKGRVMIDPEGFYLYNAGSGLINPVVDSDDVMDPTDLKEDQFFFCAHWINGFSFPEKIWCQMAVGSLADVEWDNEAFKNLVIEENRRDLVHALVKAHRPDDTAFDDAVQNHGKGLVGLITGNPGVGKTFTAEAVAEVTHCPLFVITAGELGKSPDYLDDRLGMILEVAQRWGCVLVIDEAEFFLTAHRKDLLRNTLASIFQRRLESCRGICILNSNHKSEIDEAFQSRLHFTLHYPDLDEASRKAVWRNLFNIVMQTSERSNVGEDDIEKLSKHALNGRQIKNIISCGVSLARDKESQVTVDDIESLLKVLMKV